VWGTAEYAFKGSFKKRSFKRFFMNVRQEVLPDGTRARTRTRRVSLKSSVPRDLETGYLKEFLRDFS
jgi:hypothetical protein